MVEKLEIQLAQVITRLRVDRPELTSFGATYCSRGGDSALEDWWSDPFSAPSFDTLPDYLRDFLDAVESEYGDGYEDAEGGEVTIEIAILAETAEVSVQLYERVLRDHSFHTINAAEAAPSDDGCTIHTPAPTIIEELGA